MQNPEKKLIKILAAGFGSGFLPRAPGTAGTAAGIVLFIIFSRLSWPAYLFWLIFFTALAVYIAGEAERLTGQKDPPWVVIDEMTGFLWTLFAISPSVGTVFLGFIFFRFFDIIKPFPVRYLQDRLPGGFGVVGDDVMAGIYSNLALQVLVELSVL